MMTQTSAAIPQVAVGRSWAQIVRKGFSPDDVEDVDATRSPLVPAARGSLRTTCRGRLVSMLGHYGWITSLDEIDYPDAASSRHGGRIYLQGKDVRAGCGSLRPGSEVLFALYADDEGLGAEDCRPALDSGDGAPPGGDAAANAKTWSASRWAAGAPAMRRPPWPRQSYRPYPCSAAVVLVPPSAVCEWLTAKRPNKPDQTAGAEVLRQNMQIILDSQSSSEDSSEDEEESPGRWSSLANRCAKAIGTVDDAQSWQARSDLAAKKQAGGLNLARFADPVVSVLDSMPAKASYRDHSPDGEDSTSAGGGDATDSDGGLTATTTGVLIAPPPGLELPAEGFAGVSGPPPPLPPGLGDQGIGGIFAPPGLELQFSATGPAASPTFSKHQHPWRRHQD